MIKPYNNQVETFCAFGVIGDCSANASTEVEDITNNFTSIDNSIKNIVNDTCNASSSQTNVANIINSKLTNATITQKNQLQNLCVLQSSLDSTISTDVQDKVLNKVHQTLETQGSIGGTGANSVAISKNLTSNTSVIDDSQFNQVTKKCILGLNQNNIINILGSTVSGGSLDQVNDGLLKCLAESSDITHISAKDATDTSNDNSQSASASSGLFASLASGGTIGIIAIVLVVLFCSSFSGFFAYLLLGSN